MTAKSLLRRLLAARGVHFFVTRFGPKKLRILAFDEKYLRGDWSSPTDGSGELPEVTANYLRKGDLLIMGCGGCSILSGLMASGLKSALGIDLSPEAIRLASRYASDNVRFSVEDMTTFQTTRVFDVILFSESIYYVPTVEQQPLLYRLTKSLKPDGVIIATFAQAVRHRYILEMIRRSFRVIEDRTFRGSIRQLIIFRAHRSK